MKKKTFLIFSKLNYLQTIIWAKVYILLPQYLHQYICGITDVEMVGILLVKVFRSFSAFSQRPIVCKCYFQVDCLAPAWNKGGLATWLDSGN